MAKGIIFLKIVFFMVSFSGSDEVTIAFFDGFANGK
jgi:hypothetical protein